MKNIINFISGTLLSTLSYFFGGWDIAIQTLLIVILLDYITGLCKSIHNKTISSEIGLKGIIKKVGFLIVVGIAVIIDNLVGNTSAVRNLVIYFFITNEIISILENWGAMGLPLPQKIFEILEQLSKSDKN